MPKCLEKTCSNRGVNLSMNSFYFDRRTNKVRQPCKECYAKKYKMNETHKRPIFGKMKADYRYDDFTEQAKKYNQAHPFIRSGDIRARIDEIKGTAARTVVI